MLQPLQHKLLKTVDELFDSDVKIIENDFIHAIHIDNPKYQNALKNGRVVSFDLILDNFYEHYSKENMATVQFCKEFKDLIEKEKIQGFYQITEVAYSLRHNLIILPFHPFIDKIQELMDFSFEAGLPKAWENFYNELYKFPSNFSNERKNIEKKTFLDFDSILPFFLILAFGFSISLFALFCEIYYYNFAAHLIKFFCNLFKKRRKEKIVKGKSK